MVGEHPFCRFLRLQASIIHPEDGFVLPVAEEVELPSPPEKSSTFNELSIGNGYSHRWE
jgi:hypothetical protein